MHGAVWYALWGQYPGMAVRACVPVELGIQEWGARCSSAPLDSSALLLVGVPGGVEIQTTCISLVTVLASERGVGVACLHGAILKLAAILSFSPLLCRVGCGMLISGLTCCAGLSHSVMFDSLRPQDCSLPARLLCPRVFSRQGYWSGFPGPPPGDLPDPGIKPSFLTSPALAGGS